MKLFKIIGALAFAAIVFVSCSKNDVQSSSNRILGRWQLESNVFNEYFNYQNHERVIYGRPNDYFDFDNSGNVAISLNGYVDYLRYYMSSGNSINIDGEIMDIRSLTNNQMVLYSRKNYNNAEYDENTYYLYR